MLIENVWDVTLYLSFEVEIIQVVIISQQQQQPSDSWTNLNHISNP